MQTDSLFNPTSNFDLRALVRRMAHSCEIQLCVYGGLSAFVYWLAFTRDYSLGEWWMTPLRTIAKLSNYNAGAGISYVLGFLALFTLYLLGLRCAKFESTPRILATIAAVTVVLNLPLLFLYPVDSADIFDNIIRGRMSAIYGLNPFVEFPHAVVRDPFYSYVAWRYFPSAYGPLWEWLAALGAFAAGNTILANVFTFKLLSVAAYIGSAALVVQILREIAPERAAYGAVFVLWNPLILYVTTGNGHNDTVMLFWVILSFFFLARQQFTLAVLAMLMGALVKFIPALFIPLMLLAAWNALPNLRARLRFLVVTGTVAAILGLVVYARFWEGSVLNLEWRWNLYTTSLSTWAWLVLQNVYDPKSAAAVVSRIGYALLALWIARELFVLRQQRKQSFAVEPYIRAALSILLFYLLVTVAWFQPWYVVWLVPLAALLTDGFVTRGVLLFCAAALCKMPLLDFVLVRNVRPAPPVWWREAWATVGILFAPWLYFLVASRKRGLKK